MLGVRGFLGGRLHKQSKDFSELRDFVVKLRNFAPFNAMLPIDIEPVESRSPIRSTLHSRASAFSSCWQHGEVNSDLVPKEGLDGNA